MAIYLTGGGEQEDYRQLDRLFMQELPAQSKIGLFAQATDEPQEALERIQYYFNDSKIKAIDLIENTKTDLNQYDALMIEGGNTFDLIRAVRDSAFFNSIKSFSQSGRPLYGDSAGAIILGCDVHTAFLGEDGDEDTQSLQDYRGLDLINPWCVHAHATEDEFDQLQDLMYEMGGPILAISEETGVCLSENEIKVFGKSDLWIFDFEGMKSIAPGQSFEYLGGLT